MDIFKALTNPVKSKVITNLYIHDAQSIKQLNKGIPISRQALTKHLNSLIKARLINAEFVGKEKHHTLSNKTIVSLTNELTPLIRRWDIRLTSLNTLLGVKNE